VAPPSRHRRPIMRDAGIIDDITLEAFAELR
jgi:hypothetical protein